MTSSQRKKNVLYFLFYLTRQVSSEEILVLQEGIPKGLLWGQVWDKKNIYIYRTKHTS
jgi:hypothetical protein